MQAERRLRARGGQCLYLGKTRRDLPGLAVADAEHFRDGAALDLTLHQNGAHLSVAALDNVSGLLPDLLSQISPKEEIRCVTADGAYDKRACHDAIATRGAVAIIPPRKKARIWKPTTDGAKARIFANWLDEAVDSMIASFARDLRSDRAAALREPWSNGQTEGQINRLKTIKRQMYGRANIDLLKARLIAPG